jgi:hypothetical protein
MGATRYALVDAETADVIGAYRSERAALRDVADAVRRYGRESAAVTSLVLIRTDVPAGRGFIAGGLELADRSLARRAADPARPRRPLAVG